MKSSAELIADMDAAVTNVANRLHELEDKAGRIDAAQAELDQLKSAFMNMTVRMVALVQ